MKAKSIFFRLITIIGLISLFQACCGESFVDLKTRDSRKPLSELGFQTPTLILGTKSAILEKTYPLPPMAVTSFEISSSGRYYLVGLESGPVECYQWAVKVIDTYTGEITKTIRQYNRVNFENAKMSPGEKFIAVLTVGGLKIFNFSDLTKVAELKKQKRRHDDWALVSNYAFTPDSDHIIIIYSQYNSITKSVDYKIDIFDLVNKNTLKTVTTDWQLSKLAIHPRGKFAAISGTDNGDIYLFNIEKGVFLKSFTAHVGRISVLRFSDDGHYLLTGGHMDNTIKIWNAENFELIWANDIHTSWITSVDYSYSLNLVATSQAFILRNFPAKENSEMNNKIIKETIRFFDFKTGSYLGSIQSGLKKFNRDIFLEFTSDGKRLVGACSHPSYIYVWKIYNE